MRPRNLILYLMIAAALTTGCYANGIFSETAVPTQTIIVPVKIVCNTAYRSSVTVPVESTKTLAISTKKENDEIVFDDLVLHTWYFDGSPHELRSLKLWVTTRDEAEEISSVLYQLSRSKPLENQVIEHGFTGLHYAYHPVSRAELQYWCYTK